MNGGVSVKSVGVWTYVYCYLAKPETFCLALSLGVVGEQAEGDVCLRVLSVPMAGFS